MRQLLYLASTLALALPGCSAEEYKKDAQAEKKALRVAGANAGSEDGQPQPPSGIGKVLEDKGVLSPVPVVTIDESVTGNDRAVLQEILDASLTVLASAGFLNHAGLIDVDYPAVYLRKGRTETASAAARLLQTEPAIGGYLPTKIKIDRGRIGAAVNSNRNSDELTMSVNGLPLTNWQANNRVQKSCAINTVAHEIAHTLSGSDTAWEPVFVDSDTSDSSLQASRRNGTTGSYVMGNLAQCSYLNSISRVGTQFMRSCVPTWYYYTPPSNGQSEESGFANLSCDKYAENDVVQIRP